ncbi:hypothetical protein BJY01DRAFT_207862 [Aspergillus pseudoustus]|uniref:Uncharacterized protein n=1 Tax=Aspergillus pseudoustus TaxID=1810923 RepID=A0ABR4KJJ8_9EURO
MYVKGFVNPHYRLEIVPSSRCCFMGHRGFKSRIHLGQESNPSPPLYRNRTRPRGGIISYLLLGILLSVETLAPLPKSAVLHESVATCDRLTPLCGG